MNRNKRTAVVLAVAVLMAAIASLGVYRIVTAMPAKQAEITTVSAVVAAHPLEPRDAPDIRPRQGRRLAGRPARCRARSRRSRTWSTAA